MTLDIPTQLFKSSVFIEAINQRSTVYNLILRFMANTMENKKMLKCLATENWKCQEEKYQFRCSLAKLFRKHLHEDHDFQCEMKILNFNNFGEFEKWKSEEENKCVVSFVSPRGRVENENETTYYYICNRSGLYTPKVDDFDRKRVLKSQGSVKINFKCTSQITARESKTNKTLNVVYWFTHYGHKKTPAHIRIDNSVRGALIRKKDLNNIKQQFNITGTKRHHHDHTSVSLLVDELKSSVENPILYYKPIGKPCEQFATILPDDFILVIQTEFQRNIFNNLGNDVICIDSTHNTTQYDVKLITVLCVDEWGEGIPILWCISNKETTEVIEVILPV
uniref:ZSWIM1/3 RNaseH-like domain-containing protein n=1 Tax=Strigamia maritima TaxID=126957 RepID=T1ITT2_STRMM